MSQTLSTQQMTARLQRKFPLGLSPTDIMDFLNEAFRKINQMGKGGMVWQLKQTAFTIPAGAQVAVPLPADFDPGKSAWFKGGINSPTQTKIPYMPVEKIIDQEHFQNTGVGQIAAWSYYVLFSPGPPTTYVYQAFFAPATAYPIGGGGLPLTLYYHALNYAPLTVGANVYFPTPDQFDSLILDLAEAEYTRVYGKGGWQILAAQATQAITELIDTYRSDRFELAGLGDVAMQATEKATERNK